MLKRSCLFVMNKEKGKLYKKRYREVALFIFEN